MLDAAGAIAGVTVGLASNPGDSLNGITLIQGQVGEQYNFGELVSSTISGRVTTDIDGNCEVLTSGEVVLEGVEIELLDNQGSVLARVVTDVEGR